MSAAVVHFIKHWDNDTKGYSEIAQADDIEHAIIITRGQLLKELVEEGEVDGNWGDLVTITKAEIVDAAQDWNGGPR